MSMERVYIKETDEFLRIISFADHSTKHKFSNTSKGVVDVNIKCFAINNNTDDCHAAKIIQRLKRLNKKVPTDFVISILPILNRVVSRSLIPKIEDKKNG